MGLPTKKCLAGSYETIRISTMGVRRIKYGSRKGQSSFSKVWYGQRCDDAIRTQKGEWKKSVDKGVHVQAKGNSTGKKDSM